MTVKSRVDPAQNRFERYAGVFPGFNEGPIQSGEQQARTAAALEVLFDFRKVVEVIFQGTANHQGHKGSRRTKTQRAHFFFCAIACELRSQMMRRPSSVRSSSTSVMYFEFGPMSDARPPVATTFVSLPISFTRRSRIP